VARLQRVFIDTSELFPFTSMDVLLTLSEDFLFTWGWTDELLDEWEEVIVREGKPTPESAASVAAAVRAHFSRYRIDPALYRDKITDDLSPDPDDRVHAAAAIYGDVDVPLTQNQKHLRTKPVLAAGVKGHNLGRVPLRAVHTSPSGRPRVVHPCGGHQEEPANDARRAGQEHRHCGCTTVRRARTHAPGAPTGPTDVRTGRPDYPDQRTRLRRSRTSSRRNRDNPRVGTILVIPTSG